MALTIEQQLDRVTRGAYATDPYLTDTIESAKQLTSPCFFGRNYNLAVALRAAMELSLFGPIRPNGEPGVIQSKKEAGLSLTYGKTTAVLKDDPYLSQTTYGLALQNLIRSSGPVMGVTGGAMNDFCNTATEAY